MLTICLVAAPQHVLAHGGEDHGDEDKASLTLPAEGAKPAGLCQFGGCLNWCWWRRNLQTPITTPACKIYLDHYADNSPVKNAVIELSSSAFSGTAKMLQPGLYQLNVKTLPATTHAIALTIEAGRRYRPAQY